MSWQQTIEKTVTGLGYDLVDVEHAPRGLLRVTIERVPGQAYAQAAEFVTVEDCEKVTRQLQYVLEVERVDYERLEVSSPGLDRPLKRETDYARFAGHEVTLTLKLLFNGRKHWRGVLQTADAGWRLVFEEGNAPQALDFTVDEVREARLVPVVDFKRKNKNRAANADAAAVSTESMGGQEQ